MRMLITCHCVKDLWLKKDVLERENGRVDLMSSSTNSSRHGIHVSLGQENKEEESVKMG